MPTTDDYEIKVTVDIRNRKQVSELTRDLQRAAKIAPQAQRTIATAGKGMQSFGRQVNNASFQLTDFIVQVQGGQAASRAFAQQAPQLLAGFGALGAALGVVAAIMPSIIAGFTGGAKAAKTLDDRIKKLSEDIGALAETVDRVDFSGWVKDFNDLDQQARLLTRSILDLRTQAAQLEFEAAIESFTGFVDVIVPGTKLANIQLASIAKNLGLSVGALEQLMPLIEEFREDPFGDPQNLERIVELLGDAGTEALPLLNRLRDLKAAQEGLQAARESAVSARQAGATGQIPTGEDGTTPSVELEKTASAAATAAIELNDYNQMILEAELGQQAFNATLAQAPEAFSASDEAASIFENTMNSAFDGVARGTQSLSDAFESMTKSIIAQLLKLAAQLAITRAFGGDFLGGAFNPATNAQGNAFSDGKVVPFARGGIVTGPTIFPMAKGMGLMGEAGPEAVLPLTRTPSGNLGVEASPVNVTINNNAPGVSVQPRQGGDGLTIDVVMDSISGAIRRGGNDVANALEESYSIGRGRAVY